MNDKAEMAVDEQWLYGCPSCGTWGLSEPGATPFLKGMCRCGARSVLVCRPQTLTEAEQRGFERCRTMAKERILDVEGDVPIGLLAVFIDELSVETTPHTPKAADHVTRTLEQIHRLAESIGVRFEPDAEKIKKLRALPISPQQEAKPDDR